MQIPPQFSAVKIDGDRAYDLARDGEVVDIAARPLWVESLTMIARPDADHVELEMVCGKGGYVRAIARDLGASLGCLGHVAWLRRVWSGPFDASDGISLETWMIWRKLTHCWPICARWNRVCMICPNCPPRPKGLHGCETAIPAW